MVSNIQHENRFYLLLKNYYDNYCCHGGKTNEHYSLADLTTAQALHSSHQSLCINVNMLKISRVKVIQIHNHVQLCTLVPYAGEYCLQYEQ